MKKQKVIDDKFKIALGSHLDYEVRRAREIFFYIVRNGVRLPNSSEITTENLVLVAFLTHIRNLYAFFYNYGNVDWASAEDYITGWLKRKTPPDNIKDYNGRINHFLSHLSYRRIDIKWKRWEIDVLYTHFREKVIEFISELSEPYLIKDLEILLEDLRKELVQ